MKKLILVALLLSGCANYVEPVFYPYIETVKGYCLEYCTGRQCAECDNILFVSVTFQEMENNSIIGNCDSTADISIDKKEWESLPQCGKEVLIMHELGHCVFNYQHTEDKTIMHPELIYQEYCANPEHYIEIFFNEGK